ncbi:MAG TPA: GDSL-type esterase/lipase family protein [Tepidisphaeraceae bacterium]|nr:GDSL-type esterase/lipase family protein [Tepidisphaeraceae bacterium]
MRPTVSPFHGYISFLLLAAALLPSARSSAQPPAAAIILDTNTARLHPSEIEAKDKKKGPAGTVETVDGQFGKAIKLSFIEGAAGGFMTAPLHAAPAWDAAEGFSFWVKGDGSDSFGGMELIDRDNFSLRYGYCFPINSRQWKKIVVRWSDLTPELAAPMMGGMDGYPPSRLGNLWFGKWFYWREYPAESYTIEQVQLEEKIAPVAVPEVEPGIKRFAAKLRARKPVTIVSMGDSLTDPYHWSNRKVRWTSLLARAIDKKYESATKIVNPAIGGTTLSQNMVLMPRWEKLSPSPDLVILWFGGNDWDAGVRGARFAQYLRVAVDRIRQQTHGSADVLLLTPCPGFARWETMRELEDAVKKVAAEKKTGLIDIAADFRKPGTPEAALKQEYWAWDKVHLGKKSQEIVRDAILRGIEAAK